MNALPYWPAMMKRATAARYCEMSAAEFERHVLSGHFPMPVKLGNTERWSRLRLDQAIERLYGGGGDDWRAKLGLSRAA